MGRKHCRKRRKCWLTAFSPFPTMFFQRLLYPGCLKSVFCGYELNAITSNKLYVTYTVEYVYEKIENSVGNQPFSPFPTILSTLLKTKIIILATFHLLSANTFNLD